MGGPVRWPGEWLAICDVCGFQFASGALIKRWDGLMVCKEDWEPRHPQDLLRVYPERITPPWTRPEAPDHFIPVCSLWGRSSFSGLAESGCARSGAMAQPFSFLYKFKADSLRPN